MRPFPSFVATGFFSIFAVLPHARGADLDPDPTIDGKWFTTTAFDSDRYSEEWNFATASQLMLDDILAAAQDGELSDSQFVARLFELLEETLDTGLTDGAPIAGGDIPQRFGNKKQHVIDKMRQGLEELEPRVVVGDYTYLDAFYPNITIRGHVILVQLGYRFFGIYREKEVHENINDAGDTAVERLYGVLQLKMKSNEVLFTAKGIPLSQNGFQWAELCVRESATPSAKKIKKGLKKREGWTVEAAHGLKGPLFVGD